MLEQIADKLKKVQKNNFTLFEKETVARESADKSLDERLGSVEQTVGTLSEDVAFLMEIANKTEWVTVTNETGELEIPSGARKYAQILELHGRWAVYPVNGYYCDYVKNYPKRILADDGRVLFELPDGIENRLPDFGIVGNYIYFIDGVPVYHRGAKVVEYFYELKEGERESGDYCYDSYKIIYLPEAEVEEIDVSDINHHGDIDIEGARSLTVEMRYSEEEVRAMIYDPDNVEMSEFNYGVGKTKFVFEV